MPRHCVGTETLSCNATHYCRWRPNGRPHVIGSHHHPAARAHPKHSQTAGQQLTRAPPRRQLVSTKSTVTRCPKMHAYLCMPFTQHLWKSAAPVCTPRPQKGCSSLAPCLAPCHATPCHHHNHKRDTESPKHVHQKRLSCGSGSSRTCPPALGAHIPTAIEGIGLPKPSSCTACPLLITLQQAALPCWHARFAWWCHRHHRHKQASHGKAPGLCTRDTDCTCT